MNSFRSYHSLIFCYVFLLKMLQLHNGKKSRNMGTLWILCLKSLRDQYEQLTEAHWGTAEVQRASKRQSPLFKEDAMNLSYESNWNILHKLKKPLCGDTSGYTSALWVRSFLLYMVQQYPHHTKISLHGYFLVITLNMHWAFSIILLWCLDIFIEI